MSAKSTIAGQAVCWIGAAAVAATVVATLGSPAAEAGDLNSHPPVKAVEAAPADGWEYQATLYVWATALNGDVGIGNLPVTTIDASIPDVLKNLDGALMGSFFAHNGHWLVLADLVLAKLSHSGSTDAYGGAGYSADLTQVIATGAFGYMLETGRPDVDFALTAGLRYVRLRGQLDLTPTLIPGSFSADQTEWWVDPTVGFYAHWDIDENWFVNAIADIGGFGVGSQLSSTGYLGVGYNWSRSFSTGIGYRYLYEDYESSGNNGGSFRYDTVTHGPTVSFSWHF